jgi:FAD binding domain
MSETWASHYTPAGKLPMISASPFPIVQDRPQRVHSHPHESFSAVLALETKLRGTIKGEVRFDDASRALYATDASNYRQVPIGVVIPRDNDDVVATLAACREFGAPVLSRGGGTSLAGQCCNVAVIIDFSKYMDSIIELDPAARRARIQPGLVLDALRLEAEKHELTFAPDPATHSRCTLNEDIGTSNYHALIASAQRQVTHGLTFLAGYRWSKCMTTADPTGFNSDVYATPVARADYSRCSYDVTNQFKASFVWDLPRTHFGWSVPDNLLSNWMVNGILTLQAGQPFTVLSGVDNSTSDIGKDRADLVANPKLPSGRSHSQKVQEYFNTAAFTVNALGTYGDTSRMFLTGPGTLI